MVGHSDAECKRSIEAGKIEGRARMAHGDMEWMIRNKRTVRMQENEKEEIELNQSGVERNQQQGRKEVTKREGEARNKRIIGTSSKLYRERRNII